MSKLRREHRARCSQVRETQRGARRRHEVPARRDRRLHQRRQVEPAQRAHRRRGAGRGRAVRHPRPDHPPRGHPGRARRYTLTDTVGFVRHLPHQLVEAFRSTLEETAEADLLVHVVDGSDAAAGGPDQGGPRGARRDRRGAGAARCRRSCWWSTRSTPPATSPSPGCATCCPTPCSSPRARGDGIDRLRAPDRRAAAAARRSSVELLLPYTEGALAARVHAEGEVLAEEHTADGTRLHARVGAELAAAVRARGRRRSRRRGPLTGRARRALGGCWPAGLPRRGRRRGPVAAPAAGTGCTVDDPRLAELSGLVVVAGGPSWAMADSGRRDRAATGSTRTPARSSRRRAGGGRPAATPRTSPRAPTASLWVGDIGDNDAAPRHRRPDRRAAAGRPVAAPADLPRRPARRRGAARRRATGVPVIVTKELGGPPAIYRPEDAARRRRADPAACSVGDVALPPLDTVGRPDRRRSARGLVTGGAVTRRRAGRRAAHLHRRLAVPACPDGRAPTPSRRRCAAHPVPVPLPGEPQGEAIAFTDGRHAALGLGAPRRGAPGTLRGGPVPAAAVAGCVPGRPGRAADRGGALGATPARAAEPARGRRSRGVGRRRAGRGARRARRRPMARDAAPAALTAAGRIRGVRAAAAPPPPGRAPSPRRPGSARRRRSAASARRGRRGGVGLDRRLAVDHRGDDLAVLGDRLLAHHHPVAVA